MRSNKEISAESPTLEQMMFLFHKALVGEIRKTLAKEQCSFSHAEAIKYIDEVGTPSMKDIAVHLKITPPSVTHLVEGMVRQKLVARTMVAGDRRTVRVVLTPQAKKLLQMVTAKKNTALRKMIAPLNDIDKKDLARIFARITQKL